MEKFRWAYVGSGSIAAKTASNITRGNNTVAAAYSRNKEKADKFAAKYGAEAFGEFESMLERGKIDGVYIATPHTAHIDYALGAMRAAFPVLCEKPVGVSAAQAELMINTSRENNVYFCEAMWTWFSDLPQKVRNCINEKKIGEIKSVNIVHAFPGMMMSKNSRLLKPETAGGALLDIGIYPITYCYRLFGYPESIVCEGNIKNGIDTGEIVTLSYNGFDCRLEMSFLKLVERFRITGTQGEIKMQMYHMARSASVKTEIGLERLSGKTDYLTEFSRAAEEIRAGFTESAYVPHSATLDCLKIMDECRRQMNLVYPFEK